MLEQSLKPESQVSSIQKTMKISCKEGVDNIFRSNQPQRILMNLVNRSDCSVEISIDTKDQSSLLTRKIHAGAPLVEEFEQVSSIEVSPANAERQREEGFITLEATLFYMEEQNEISRTIASLLPQACVGDAVSVAPDSDPPDCLWKPDIIWRSQSPRNISLSIEVTGKHDLRVDLEGPSGIFQGFNVSAAPAPTQFRKLVGDFEGIVSVRVQGKKSPVNSCSNCKYKYNICYVRRPKPLPLTSLPTPS